MLREGAEEDVELSEFKDEIKDNIDLLVVGVSSKGIEWIGNEISKFYNSSIDILLLTKGLALINDKFETLAEKLNDILKKINPEQKPNDTDDMPVAESPGSDKQFAIDAIEKIIEYSTIPGTSRHHWGTDIDIIDGNAKPRPKSVLESELFHGDGPFCKIKNWLTENANSFGFYEVYTNNANRKGFKYEPWHYSYAPVSKPMLLEYKKLDVKKIIQQEKILGSEHFTDTFITNYKKQHLLDINPELL